MVERTRAAAEMYELPMASLMMVQPVAEDALEASWFGDCTALVLRPGEPVEVVGEGFDGRAGEASDAAAMAAAHGVAPAGNINQPEFLAGLRARRNRYNGGGGIWIFAPDVRCAEHARTARVLAPPGSWILLASDGFVAIATDYAAYDAASLMAAARITGLQALLDELRALENADPEGRRYPRFKKSDDATAVLLRVEA